MPNPTIVTASLSDEKLKESIDAMVKNLNDGLNKMKESTDSAVEYIQKSLQRLGNTKIDTGGSSDGGASKRAKAQNAETDSVEKTITARGKQIKQNQETAMSFDQIAAAQQKAIQSQGDNTLKKSFNKQELQQYIDRLRELQAEYIKVNTQQGGGVNSDKIKADMRNLEELIAKYKEILKNLDYVNSRQGTIDVKKWVQDLGAVDDRYKKLVRWYSVLEKEDQRRIASEEKANQKRLADLEKEKAAQDKVTKSYQDSVLKAEFGKVMRMPTTNIDEIRAKFERLRTIIANIRELGILSPEKISAADSEVKKLGASIQRYEKFEQERIASEQKFIIEQAKEVEQTQTLEGRVKGLAQAIRERLKEEGRFVDMQAYGKDLRVYAENDSRAKGLTIEQQILQQLEAEQRVIQQQVSTSQQLNNERKKYVSPTINDDTYQITRNAIANKLGIDTSKVINADAQYDSIKRVGDALKQLQDAYTRMTNEERNSPIGKQMIRQMQELQRQSQQLRAQMSRPISFAAAMKGDDKTLDDIAYKMQRLRAYRQGIDLTKPNAANEIKKVDEALAKLQKDADKWMNKSHEMIKSNTALGRSWNYMKNRLAFYFTVGASTQFVKNLIEIRSQYEMNERALGILIDSAERGTQIFNELSQMALVSPYTLIELSTAAKQLTAYDVAAKDVVDTTRRLADMAAAVGIPIERLTYALGQIKAYGYLNSRDARMFANAGIPLVKQLSDYYTELEGKLVSTADVYDRIKKKSIDYNEVMEVVYKMTDQGGKFFDFQAKMADTLKVRLANLTLAWNNMLNDIGKDTQGVLTFGIGALRELFLNWKKLDEVIKSAGWVVGIRTAFMFIVWGALKAGNALAFTNKQMALSAVFGTKLAGVLKTVGRSLVSVAKNPITWWSLLALAIFDAANALFGVNEAQKALNESIRNGAKDNYNNISKFLEQYQKVRDSLYAANAKGVHRVFADNFGKTVTADKNNYLVSETQIKDIDKNEAKKAWEAVREQIELTVVSSDKYIGNLLSISNMSERVRQGFNLLDDIQVVNAALKELDDDTIKVSKDLSAWWNAWQAPDGLIGNLKDYQETLNDIIAEYGTLESFRENTFLGGKGSDDLNDYETALERFRNDLQKTTDSIINFIELKGWSGDESKINQVFEQITKKLVLDNQLDPQKAFTLQIEVEEARSKAAKSAQAKRLNDIAAAYEREKDRQASKEILDEYIKEKKIYDAWEQNNGRTKVEWERFTKWLKEQHIYETTAAFRNMNAEQIKSLNFQEGEYRDFVTKMATQYAKENKMSVDEVFEHLGAKINDASTWSLVIPVLLNIKPLSWLEEDFKKRLPDLNLDISSYKNLSEMVSDFQKKRKEGLEEIKRLEDAGIDATKGKTEADVEHYKEVKKEVDDVTAALKAYNAPLVKETKGKKKDDVLEALKQEVSLVEKLQSDYDKLTKSGASQSDALDTIRGAYGKTIRLLNTQLQSYGLPQIDISQLITGKDPHKALEHFKRTLNTLVSKGLLTLERSKEIEAVIDKFTLSAKTYDLDMITKGLNNELGKLKDEYELAIAIDADPELGNAFADMMGINVESLPHTVKEYADRYSTYLNKYLKGKNSSLQFTGDELRGLTRDDITAFRGQVDTGTFNQEWFDAILKAYEDISGKRKKDLEETEKWKNSLIEKYGNLQDKLTKIYKDSVQNQVNAVKTFGTEDQKSEIVRLQLRLEETDNPAELSEINTEIAEIVKDVTDKNPIALKLVTASGNQTKADASKAYWEDFKNSELYTMTFEDMANNSTRAIQLIIDKLNNLKNDVKEDPASMKALIKSLEDAEKELNARDPFGGVARSLREMANASQEVKTAQEALWGAEVDVELAQQEVDNAEDGTPEEQAAAQQKLADAVQRRATAQVKLTQAENKGKKAQENLKSSLQGITGELNNVKSLFDTVSSLFRAGGDNETADAIDAISEGFGVMTTVIMGVVAAMVLLESSQPWLLAIAAALSVIVGLVKFLSGNDNKRIDEEIKDSERAVKRLENTYKNLEVAIENAAGAAVIGAKQAAIANKELQLVELKRQLRLEESRSSKDKDEDKIADLKGQIIDLRNEIKKSFQEIVTSLLGISDVSSAAEDFMSTYIESLRKGEDAQRAFSDSWKEMIANMIKQIYVTKVIAPQLNALVDEMNERITNRSKKEAEAYRQAVEEQTDISTMSDADIQREIFKNKTGKEWKNYLGFDSEYVRVMRSITQAEIDAYRNDAESRVSQAKENLDKVSIPTINDLDLVAKGGADLLPILEAADDELKDLLERYDLYDKDSNQLSSLQQGIQGITEDTAGAIEAYLNIVSQRIFEHGEILMQIRDTLTGMNLDAQLGTQAQMLLQLQNSYQMQVSIRNILNSALNPSGSAFMVELNS